MGKQEINCEKKTSAAMRLREHGVDPLAADVKEALSLHSIIGVAIIDVSQEKAPFIYINLAFERITGFKDKKILGKNFKMLLGKKNDRVSLKRIDLAIKEQQEETVELQLLRSNGEVFWSELSLTPIKSSFNEVRHFVFIINDITHRKEMEEQLLRQATHDALTGLPNRALLLDRIEHAILQAKKNKSMVGLIILDLDRFKLTNDTLGHGVGDKLLQQVANRLLVATNDFNTVARFGGDEFAILLPDIHSIETIEMTTREVLSKLEKPFKIEKHQLKITACAGISTYPLEGEDYETLMKHADLSMHHAKNSGRNTYCMFEAEMNRCVVNHAQIDNALNGSLQKKEFYLAYQPLIDIKRKCIKGMEALLRWNSCVLGHVSPFDFIPIAEENGLIIDIGAWVLEEACTQTMRWHQRGYSDLSVAVNISGKQLHQFRLPELIANILHKTGLPPQCLELELTENLLVENVDHAVEIMHQLKDLGIKLAVDDFGTGYSSLSYLKQFPVDKLKIDKSFIQDMACDENDAAIVKAIINLGHSLNLEVLAEGIENEYQESFLIDHDCDFAQGYYFSTPEKPENIEFYLASHLVRKERPS